MSSTARAIGSRFRDEIEYVGRYVRLLQTKATVHDRQVDDLNRILKRVRIAVLPTRRYDRAGEAYTTEELAELMSAIRRADPEVFQTILGHEQGLDSLPSFGLDSVAADYMDRIHEWVEYFLGQLSDDPEEDDTDALLKYAFREAVRVEAEYDEEDRIPRDALKLLLSTALDHAEHAWRRHRIDAMVYAREQFDEIEVLARMANPDAEINVQRQGFVLLMTAFDAAVFDLTRIAFRGKFFELVGIFGKQDKVALEEIAEAGDFETLRDQIVEEQLKKRYVKDLLGLFQAIGIEVVDEKCGDRPAQLIELVQRRNLHVHNRGIVDERYLETDPKTGKAKWNLFDLKLGQLACIDRAYFDNAVRLCANCVERLVRWVAR
jgi:hypothetical protein